MLTRKRRKVVRYVGLLAFLSGRDEAISEDRREIGRRRFR